MVTALYLAHLNPVTNAHVEIIRRLQEDASRIKVMPVLFVSGGAELNSRSFPFTYGVRRRMLKAVFGESVDVSRDYSFTAPFRWYLLSPKSWTLRRRILGDVVGDYFSYTGDGAEALMLRVYGLRPRKGRRLQLSATSVKENMYKAARGDDIAWEEDVPEEVARIIREEWDVVRRFASSRDETKRVLGMKFPRAGW